MTLIRMFALLLCLVIVAAPVAAQSPINSLGAMQPSVGTFLVHEMLSARLVDGDASTLQRDVLSFALTSQISYGVLPNLSFNLDLPVVVNHYEASASAASDTDLGLGDTRLFAKWRIVQQDTSPIDTFRLALLGGARLPGTVPTFDRYDSQTFTPMIGAVMSMVRGRHGFNASAFFEPVIDDRDEVPDLLRYDLSYLLRLAPAEFTAATSGGAWYGVLELNGIYETNGDNQLFLAPGLMYEAARWTIDCSVQIPIWQELDDRPETEVIIAAGVRIPF